MKRLKGLLYYSIDLFWLSWSPLLRRVQSRKIAFFLMDIINLSYPFWFYFIRKDRRSHESLETYRKTFDLWDVDFYDRFVGKEWFKNQSILDIGAFVGGKAEYWAARGAKRVIGIDLSARGIALANENLSKYRGDNLKFYHMSSGELALEPDYQESFDWIVSFTVFEHIEASDLLGVLNDAHKLLRADGTFMVVYNYYYDRFGAHTHLYFAHPWPQMLFREELIWAYCDMQLMRLQSEGGMGYYPKGHRFSRRQDNDCFMFLNKLMPYEFDEILKNSDFCHIEKIPYKRNPFILWLHRKFPKVRFFTPSYLYLLKK